MTNGTNPTIHGTLPAPARAKNQGKPSGILPCDSDGAAGILTHVTSVSELNKLKIKLFVEAILNEGRLELINDLVAADYLGHFPPAETGVAGPQGMRRLVSSRRRAHPGLHIKIEDQIAEDDQVATRWLATTTAPGGRAAGAPARRIPCCAGISITRLLAGKLVDSRTECTNLTSGRPAEPAMNARPVHLDRHSPAWAFSAISPLLRRNRPDR